jgi:hypothetical protein
MRWREKFAWWQCPGFDGDPCTAMLVYAEDVVREGVTHRRFLHPPGSNGWPNVIVSGPASLEAVVELPTAEDERQERGR